MPWHERQRQTPTRRVTSRGGYFLLEAAVTLALLAAAAAAVASLAASLAQERRAQMQRTAERLQAENIVERLRAADYDDLPRLAEQWSSPDLDQSRQPDEADASPEEPVATAEQSGTALTTRVRIEPFTAGDVEGRHVLVAVSAGQPPAGRPRTTELELWRFGSRRDAASGDAPEGEGSP